LNENDDLQFGWDRGSPRFATTLLAVGTQKKKASPALSVGDASCEACIAFVRVYRGLHEFVKAAFSLPVQPGIRIEP